MKARRNAESGMEIVSRRFAHRMETIVLALVLMGFAYSLYRATAQSLGRKEAAIHAADLRSLAAEGEMLAAEQAEGRLTATFLAMHSRMLGTKCSDANETLRTAKVATAVEGDVTRLAGIAAELAASFAALASTPRDSPAPRDLRQGFARSFAALSALEKALRE